ncbi:MAG: LysR substrate-binding domain-containing protein [Myxococcota bacterium]
MASPNLRGLDLNLLFLFEALYRERKLTRAAQSVGLSQPAASQALGRLRVALGDPLFVRRRGGMEPTPNARTIAGAVREALQTLELGLLAAQAFDPNRSERVFRIGFGEVGEAALLPRLAARVSQQAPCVSLRSVAGQRLEVEASAARGELDRGFSYVPRRGGGVHIELLGPEVIVVIARRDHPRIDGVVSLDGFFEERHVVLDMEDERRQQIERMLRASGPPRRVLAIASHYTTVPSIVVASDGLAMVPRSMVRSPLYQQQLQCLSPPMPLAPLPLHVGWHGGFHTDPGHTWLRARLADLI